MNNMDINKEEVGVSTLRRYLYLVQIHKFGSQSAFTCQRRPRAHPTYFAESALCVGPAQFMSAERLSSVHCIHCRLCTIGTQRRRPKHPVHWRSHTHTHHLLASLISSATPSRRERRILLRRRMRDPRLVHISTTRNDKSSGRARCERKQYCDQATQNVVSKKNSIETLLA